MSDKLVSIIIPTFNRAHLIAETLDSIINQTYSNWECIVVDDGSTDNTESLLESYSKSDNRIFFFLRPRELQKGANSCRNYGLKMSKGVFVNWFDSDDIMLPHFLETKIEFLQKRSDLNFVIGRGINFYEDGTSKPLPIRNNNTSALNHNNFVLFDVFWITHDFLVVKEDIGEVRFDETLNSGQEYNFFVKILAIRKLKGEFIDEILFRRRWHVNSIQGKFVENDDDFCFDLYVLYKNTYSDVGHLLNERAKKHLFRRIASRSFELKRRKLQTPELNQVIKLYMREKGFIKTILFRLSLIIAYYTGKGYRLMDMSRK